VTNRIQKYFLPGFIIAIVAVVILMFSGLAWNRVRYKQGVTQTLDTLKADSELSFLAETIPPEATDIRYYVHPYSFTYEASFLVDETVFLNWVQDIESDAVVDKDPNGKPIPPDHLEQIVYEQPFHLHETKDQENEGFIHPPGYYLHHVKTARLRSIRVGYSIDRNRAYMKMRR